MNVWVFLSSLLYVWSVGDYIMWIAVCYGRRTHRKPHCLSCLCATWPTSSPTIKAPIFFIISLEQRVPGGLWWALEYSYLSSPKQSSQNRSTFFGSLPAPVDPESPKYFFPLFVDPGRNLKDEWRSRDMLYQEHAIALPTWMVGNEEIKRAIYQILVPLILCSSITGSNSI